MLLNKRSSKIVFTTMMLLCLGIQSMDAAARIGGGGLRSSGFSGNRSGSTYSNSSRAGGGNNAGMQRNDVVNRERQNAAPIPNQPINQQAASQPVPQPAPSKIGLGHVAGAAVAGAAVGYMLNSHDNNQAMQNNGGVNGQFGSSNGMQPSNPGFPWGTILMFLLGGFGLMWLLKRNNSRQSIGANLKEVLNPNYQAPQPLNSVNQAFESEALRFFSALQDANNRGDIEFMKSYSVGEMQNVLIDEIKQRTTPSTSQFYQMAARVIDMTVDSNQSIASVRFTGMVAEGSAAFAPMDEVWHLVRQTGEWQLAGIEQI